MTPHRTFFGDREREFAITFSMIPELERTTSAGIGELCRRLFAGNFRHADIGETIRVALIGGGTKPNEAAQLCDTYLPLMTMAERMSLAVVILDRLYFGDKAKGERAA